MCSRHVDAPLQLVALDGGLEASAAVVGEGVDAELYICGAIWAGSALSDVGTIGSPTGKEKAPS